MRSRPTAVLVIAICHFIFGGLGLFCGACSGVMGASGLGAQFAQRFDPDAQRQAEKRKADERIMVARVPGYRLYTSFNVAMTWILSGAMVASGIGLLSMKPWGHWLSTGYAMASILVNVVVIYYGLTYLGPVELELMRNAPPPNMNRDQVEMVSAFAQASVVGGPCIMMTYPIVVLVVMLLPSTVAAFNRGRRRDVANTDDD
jgi:hypothetical protein